MLNHLSIPGINLGHSFIKSTDVYRVPILGPNLRFKVRGIQLDENTAKLSVSLHCNGGKRWAKNTQINTQGFRKSKTDNRKKKSNPLFQMKK